MEALNKAQTVENEHDRKIQALQEQHHMLTAKEREIAEVYINIIRKSGTFVRNILHVHQGLETCQNFSQP